MARTDFLASLPMLIVAVTAIVVMLAIAVRRSHIAAAALSLTGLAAAFISLWPTAQVLPWRVAPLLVVDRFAFFYFGLLIAAAAVITLIAFDYLARRQEHKEEFYLLTLLALLGSMVLASANHFVTFFLGLELLSVSLYTLIAYLHTERLPLEAGIKYLVLAAASSAFLLFGLAFIYAQYGTMDLARLAEAATKPSAGAAHLLPLAGAVLVITAIGFKLAVVPFHLWTPDVYEGAPLPVTALVATVSKAGVFAFLLRWFSIAETPQNTVLWLLFALISMASMLAGNLLALRQNNLKRLLAYSSIAHMGYFLVAFLAGGELGRTAATYYLTAYLVTILGAFSIMTALSGSDSEAASIDNYRGLFWNRPVLAAILSAMMLSLAGIPLTAGFLGKFYVVAAGVSSLQWLLILVLVVSSTIGLYYYLRVIVAMYSPADGPLPSLSRTPVSAGFALATLTVMLFWLGVYPAPVWETMRTAVEQIR